MGESRDLERFAERLLRRLVDAETEINEGFKRTADYEVRWHEEERLADQLAEALDSGLTDVIWRAKDAYDRRRNAPAQVTSIVPKGHHVEVLPDDIGS